ncbi:hypothetical protein EWM64_g8295 [Hericium alpestre]|uniref:Abscisic acid G-protein coupled receptor-like domain-containing protein n=1 Tax=Hericium alpestre TaxID=135208 RepID=A0A4Y9ZNU0_9AGAM|nr:hypothetical protein EWM64_g8295 [Hericium alpestre]
MHRCMLIGYISELSNLKTELSALASLEEHMISQLTWMRQQHGEAEYDRTWTGKVLVLGRRAMGFYCIFRGLSSLINILLPATKPSADRSYPDRSYPDLLTSLIIMLLSLFSSDPAFPSPALKSDLSSILRQVNLALVGIIIWSSVRRVLRGVARALRMTSRNKTASFMLLVLAQLMGTYLLSTLIQLRTSFPPPLASDDSPADPQEVVNLFTTLPEYQFFGPVFDWSFLLAGGGAALVEWARDKMTDGPDVD